MNFFDMREQFDRIHRTLDDTTFQEYRDDYLNMAWRKIAEMFAIPSLKRKANLNSVSGTSVYPFPYDYGGSEAYLWYKDTSTGAYRRLDPVTEEVLGLMYEHRSGNRGQVLYYDWTTPVGSDLAVRSVTLVNDAATLACATAAAADVGHWVRFDPASNSNPGDYGFRITGAAPAVSWTLDRPYRGPSIATVGRVRPAEQQQFVVYGTPSSSVTSAFEIVYYANPRRLFNDADVTEWPNMGLAVVQMAISIGYDFMHFNDQSNVWFGRAMAQVGGLQKRRARTQTLVTDLTVGSVSGRRTGPRSRFTRG